MVPTLVVIGDEDDHCLQPGIFLKRTIPACGLWLPAKTGHTLNLEEPALFNRCWPSSSRSVEAGRWLPRDSRAKPAEIMKDFMSIADHVSRERLWERHMALARHGATPAKGVNRQALSAEEIAARRELIEWARPLGSTRIRTNTRNLFLI